MGMDVVRVLCAAAIAMAFAGPAHAQKEQSVTGDAVSLPTELDLTNSAVIDFMATASFVTSLGEVCGSTRSARSASHNWRQLAQSAIARHAARLGYSVEDAASMQPLIERDARLAGSEAIDWVFDGPNPWVMCTRGMVRSSDGGAPLVERLFAQVQARAR